MAQCESAVRSLCLATLEGFETLSMVLDATRAGLRNAIKLCLVVVVLIVVVV